MAAEYVLGTLEAVARRAAEALAARNPAFAELVAEWERRLAPLAEDIQPVAPPAGLLARIENILDILGPVRGAAPMARPLRREPRVRTAWRFSALSAGAIAAALALYVAVTELIPEAPQTRTVAVLNQAAATPAMIVSLDLTAGRMIVCPLTETETGLARQLAAGEKSLELWLVPPDGGAPRSLGLLPPEGEFAIALSPQLEKDVISAVALAVSVEPPGGSPSGAPTGRVIYQGAVLPSAG